MEGVGVGGIATGRYGLCSCFSLRDPGHRVPASEARSWSQLVEGGGGGRAKGCWIEGN